MVSQLPKNIFIIGAQSTGKSTLVGALDELFRTQLHHLPGNGRPPHIIRELARSVLRELKIDRDDIVHDPAKSFIAQKAILEAQLAAEAKLGNTSENWYISDRSGIDPIVYTELYIAHDKAQELLDSSTWAALEENMRRGLVVVCEAGCEWQVVDDGIRAMPKSAEFWDKIDQTFRQLLRNRGIRYIVIPRDVVKTSKRVDIVLEALSLNLQSATR